MQLKDVPDSPQKSGKNTYLQMMFLSEIRIFHCVEGNATWQAQERKKEECSL
jgi:hypothetical protein